MLSFRIVREDQSNIEEISEFAFSSGENRTLKLQLINAYDKQPYLLSGTATASIVLPNNTLTPLSKAASIDATNKSLISAVLSETETAALISGYIKVIVLDGADTKIAVKDNVLRKSML